MLSHILNCLVCLAGVYIFLFPLGGGGTENRREKEKEEKEKGEHDFFVNIMHTSVDHRILT